MRITLAVAVACLTFGGLAAAGDATAAIRIETHIPAEGLGPALTKLAKEFDFQVLYRTEIVSDLKSPGAMGALTSDEALGKVLTGTGLTYKYLDAKTVTIIPVSAANLGQLTPPNGSGSPDDANTSKEAGKKTSQGFRVAQVDQGKNSNSSSVKEQVSPFQESSKSSSVGLEEIVVTAQKRQERLQDVPISVSALSGTQLDSSRFEGIEEALATVPGVSMIGQSGSGLIGGGAMLAIRGVTASGPTLAGASPIGYYIDSIPFGLVRSAGVPDADVYDLQRIEVLRGPQGTLYGANSEGGLVRILTNDADLNGGFDFKARTSVSATDSAGGANYGGDAAINLPIVDGILAARLVVGQQHFGGWIDNPTQFHINDADLTNLRLKINAQPTDDLSITLSAWHTRDTYGSLSASLENGFTPNPMLTPNSVGYDAYGLKIGYDFQLFTLLSQTSYLRYASAADVDLTAAGLTYPYSALAISTSTGIFTQELTLSSELKGPWQWTLGGIFRNGKDEFVESGALFPDTLFLPDTSKSAAVYGELSRRFFRDLFQLTIGGREFHDDVSSSSRGPVSPGAPPYNESFSYSKFTPRVVLSWFPTKELSVYTSYAKGFRSGMPQDAIIGIQAPEFPPLRPDTLNTYEMGAKGTLFDHRVSFDAAVYYMKWDDVQQELATPVVLNGQTLNLNAFVNSKSASGPGIEFSTQLQIVEGLDLGLDGGWNDLTSDSNVYSGGALYLAKGQRLEASPEFTAGAFVQYTFGLGATGYKGHFSVSDNYTSKMNSGLLSGALNNGDSITLSRASFSIDAPSNWVISLYGDNLNNDRGTPYVQSGSVAAYDIRLRPRTVGLQIQYHLK